MGLGMWGSMLLFWAVLIAVAVFIVRFLFQSNASSKCNVADAPLSAQQILEQRYARGEITQEQFRTIQKDLEETRFQ